ncbi:MAG: cysteine-rich CWC family protein [Planctomycetes bacterium]|nr:cysteine-rich CWC family protein [Planctomycetota bacterium]
MDAVCDPSRCPLCGKPNACAIAAGSDRPCWCAGVTIDAAALQRVPPAARGRACVCTDCAGVSSSAASSARRCDDPAGP